MGTILAAAIVLVVAVTATALGQDSVAPEVQKSFWDTVLTGEFIAKVTPIILGGQIALRGVAEGLTRIASELEVVAPRLTSPKLKATAAWLSDASWIVGVVVGKVGIGTPKLVLEEKARQLATPK